MTPPDAPTPPEAPELATLPPALLILMDKADDWLEASKLANRDYATAQHGIAADLKRKAFVEFIHASVRENPKTLQTGLSLLRSLARRLQEAEADRARLEREVRRLCASVTHEGVEVTSRVMTRAVAARTEKGGLYAEPDA